MKVVLILVAVLAAASALPYEQEKSQLEIEDEVAKQAAEYAASMAMYARRNNPEAKEDAAEEESKAEKHADEESKPEKHADEEQKPQEPSTKQALQIPSVVDVVNNFLTALALPNITAASTGASLNTTAIAQGLVLAAQQIATNIANQNTQATLTSLALFTNVTNSLLNLPNIFRFPSTVQSAVASSDEAQFKKISSESPAEQKPDKPVFHFQRRPEYPIYPPQPYPYYGPYSHHPYPYSYYQQPYNPAPYYFRGQYGPGAASPQHQHQFRRPADSNPTADPSLSDLEALAQLEALLDKDENGYYREAEARGLLSSLSTGANSVRSGFKNIYNSISAALPQIVYKTLLVPSLASGGPSSSSP